MKNHPVRSLPDGIEHAMNKITHHNLSNIENPIGNIPDRIENMCDGITIYVR